MEMPDLCSIYDIRFLVRRGIVITPPMLKTLDAIIVLKRATADEVAKYTGRARTIESRYLAKLNKAGIIAKIKEGRKVYYIEPISAVKEHLDIYGDSITPEQLAHMISLPADIVKLIINSLKQPKQG
ncbi:MAG: helix-turn-helix domain-containing protein [Desulfurococcaceae archaeon]